MTTYYVSATGNDGNAGTTTGAPWKSIQYGCEQLVAGDTLRIMAGTYNERVWIGPGHPESGHGGASCVSGTSGSRITVMAHDSGNKPILTSSLRTTNNRPMWKIRDRSYWTIDGIRIENFWIGGFHYEALNANVSAPEFKNLEVYNLQNDSTTLGNDVGAFAVFMGTTRHTVQMTDGYCYNIHCNKIRNGIHDSYDEGFRIFGNSKNMLVENCSITDGFAICFNAAGSTSAEGSYKRAGQPEGVTFRNCSVYGTTPAAYGAGTGFYCDQIKGELVIEGCYAERCTSGFFVGLEPGWSDYMVNTNQVIVRNNVSKQNYIGFAAGATFAAEECLDCLPYPIYQYENAEDIVSNIVLAHNVAYNDSGTWGYPFGWGISQGVRVYNNVFVNTENGELMIYSYKANGVDLHADGNLYYAPNHTPRWEWPNNVYRTSLSALVSNSPHEDNGQYGPPVFTDTANGDWTLATGEIGSGDAIPLTTASSAQTTSTSLQVGDHRFFTPGDKIRIAGGTVVTVTAVNRSTSTLTLSAARTWSAGARIDYDYGGSAPSIGLTAAVGSDQPDVPVVDPAPPTDNVIGNPGFLQGTTGWTYIGEGTFSVENGVATIVKQEGGTDWLNGEGQLFYTGFGVYDSWTGIEAGLYVRSPDSTTMILNVSSHVDPWDDLGLRKTLTITSTRTKYTQTFTPTRDAPSARLRFIFQQAGTYVIDAGYLGGASGSWGSGESDDDGGAFDPPTPPPSTDSLTDTMNSGGRGSTAGSWWSTHTAATIGDISAGAYDYFGTFYFELPKAIPSDATITEADLTVKTLPLVGTPNAIVIAVDDAADASAITSWTDYNGKTWYGSTSWSGMTSYSTIDTADISALIQYLIDTHTGLANGAGVQVRIADGSGYSGAANWFEIDIDSVLPVLNISWSNPSGASSTVSVMRTVGLSTQLGVKVGL